MEKWRIESNDGVFDVFADTYPNAIKQVVDNHPNIKIKKCIEWRKGLLMGAIETWCKMEISTIHKMAKTIGIGKTKHKFRVEIGDFAFNSDRKYINPYEAIIEAILDYTQLTEKELKFSTISSLSISKCIDLEVNKSYDELITETNKSLAEVFQNMTNDINYIVDKEIEEYLTKN